MTDDGTPSSRRSVRARAPLAARCALRRHFVRTISAFQPLYRTPPPPVFTPPKAADGVDGDALVVRLDAATPQAAAEARAEARAAALNAELGGRLRAASSWQELVDVLDAHGADLNYINVALLASRAGALAPGASPSSLPRPKPGRVASGAAASAAAALPPPPLADLERVGALVLERAAAFQSEHFAAAAAGLAAAGLEARAFWRAFCGAAERKVPAMRFDELAVLLVAVASSE